MYKVSINVMPKPEVLDAQGRTLVDMLADQQIKQCSIGKHIELHLEGSKEKVTEKAHELSKSILCNSLIEEYKLSIEEMV